MGIDAWLPVGHTTESGERFGRAVHGADDWQVFESAGGGRILVAKEPLARRWAELGLVDDGWMSPLVFGGERFATIFSGAGYALCPIVEYASPESKNEALAFASALKGDPRGGRREPSTGRDLRREVVAPAANIHHIVPRARRRCLRRVVYRRGARFHRGVPADSFPVSLARRQALEGRDRRRRVQRQRSAHRPRGGIAESGRG